MLRSGSDILTWPLEIRETLVVERVDWNLGNIDVSTGFLFPSRRVIFDTVADCRPEYRHVDRGVLVWLGLQIFVRSFVTRDSLGATGEDSRKSSSAAKEAGASRLTKAADNPSCAAR
jgi:hypothetical protein